MNSIATIGYTSNLYARDQKTINYFEFQAMLADQVSDRLHWYATIHPRDEADAYVDASERLSLCVQSKLSGGDKVLIVGGDLTGLCHVQSWHTDNQGIGVDGMAVEDFELVLSDAIFTNVVNHMHVSEGLTKAAVGVWWPSKTGLMQPCVLPKNLQVLYVPELVAHQQMSMLVEMVEGWL